MVARLYVLAMLCQKSLVDVRDTQPLRPLPEAKHVYTCNNTTMFRLI